MAEKQQATAWEQLTPEQQAMEVQAMKSNPSHLAEIIKGALDGNESDKQALKKHFEQKGINPITGLEFPKK